jgi:hypothetical protein
MIAFGRTNIALIEIEPLPGVPSLLELRREAGVDLIGRTGIEIALTAGICPAMGSECLQDCVGRPVTASKSLACPTTPVRRRSRGDLFPGVCGA